MDFNKISNPEQLLEFMGQNIKYGFARKNGEICISQEPEEWNDWYEQCVVQTGEQVLNTKVGTCWDQVELERLWFEKNHFEIKTIFIWFEVDYKNDFPTHTFLLYKKGNKWYWFENAFESYRGIHEFNTVKEAVEYVISKQLEYAIGIGVAKIEDKKLIKSYEFSKLEIPFSVVEYLNHVTQDINQKQL